MSTKAENCDKKQRKILKLALSKVSKDLFDLKYFSPVEAFGVKS